MTMRMWCERHRLRARNLQFRTYLEWFNGWVQIIWLILSAFGNWKWIHSIWMCACVIDTWVKCNLHPFVNKSFERRWRRQRRQSSRSILSRSHACSPVQSERNGDDNYRPARRYGQSDSERILAVFLLLRLGFSSRFSQFQIKQCSFVSA